MLLVIVGPFGFAISQGRVKHSKVANSSVV